MKRWMAFTDPDYPGVFLAVWRGSQRAVAYVRHGDQLRHADIRKIYRTQLLKELK